MCCDDLKWFEVGVKRKNIQSCFFFVNIDIQMYADDMKVYI